MTLPACARCLKWRSARAHQFHSLAFTIAATISSAFKTVCVTGGPGWLRVVQVYYRHISLLFLTVHCCFSGKRMAESEELEDGAKRLRSSPSTSFERAVFIDCTWNQTKTIIKDERLKGLF
jgi:hypothetical protein